MYVWFCIAARGRGGNIVLLRYGRLGEREFRIVDWSVVHKKWVVVMVVLVVFDGG